MRSASTPRSLFKRSSAALASAGTAGAVLLLASVVPAISNTGAGDARQGGQQPASTAAAAVTEREFSLAYRFAPGERTTYTLEYQTEAAADFRNAVAGAAPPPRTLSMTGLAHSFRTFLKAEFTTTVLDKTADGFLIAYTLRNPDVRLEVEGQKNETQTEIIRRDLSREIVFASVDPQGRIKSIRLDPSTHKLSQNFIKAVLAVTEFVLPVEEQPAPLYDWGTEEEDVSGKYIARYRETFVKHPTVRLTRRERPVRMFVKTKLKYLNAVSGKSRRGVYEVAPAITSSGSLGARFDLQKHRLLSLGGSETQTASLAGHLVGQTKTGLCMNISGHEQLGATQLSALLGASAEREKVSPAVGLAIRVSLEESEAALHRANLGNATLASLLSALLDESITATSAGDVQLYLKFRALIYLQPEVSARLGQILASADPQSRAAGILTDALGNIGHAEAQTALVSAIRARAEGDVLRPKLLLALGLSDAPSQLTEDLLRELAYHSPSTEVSTLALYLLGAAARHLSATAPERAAKIVNAFIRDSDTAAALASPELRKRTLLALGTTASAQALPTLSRFLDDPAPELRTAAVAALQWFEAGAADELLLKVLSADPEPAVRYESAVTLGERSMTPANFQTQRKVFQTDKDDSVRLAVLSNLWRAREVFPEVLPLVKRAGSNDPSPEVRRMAKSLAGKS